MMGKSYTCDCLKNPNHRHWNEWNEYFPGYKNVRIVPQPLHSTGPERINVQYPLARSIARGALSRKGIEAFKIFDDKSTLVLCNLRIPLPVGLSKVRGWKDKRPDLIVVSSRGDIVVVQCKPLKGIRNATDDIRAFITVNDMASNAPIKSTTGTFHNPIDKWNGLYNEKYPRHLKALDLRSTLGTLFSFKTDSNIKSWSSTIMDNIKNSEVSYGFAFDGTFDSKITSRLLLFSRQFNEEMGLKCKLYYFAVQGDGSFDVVKATDLHKF